MVGLRTAAPRAARPSPMICPPKKIFSSTSVGLLFVFLLGELLLLLEEEDETPPPNLSWQRSGETRMARGRRKRWSLMFQLRRNLF